MVGRSWPYGNEQKHLLLLGVCGGTTKASLVWPLTYKLSLYHDCGSSNRFDGAVLIWLPLLLIPGMRWKQCLTKRRKGWGRRRWWTPTNAPERITYVILAHLAQGVVAETAHIVISQNQVVGISLIEAERPSFAPTSILLALLLVVFLLLSPLSLPHFQLSSSTCLFENHKILRCSWYMVLLWFQW